MKLVIDTNILQQLCHPNKKKYREVALWLKSALESGDHSFYVPSIADYELRRKLLHLIAAKKAQQESVERLDQLGNLLDFIELERRTLREASKLWAEARSTGKSTASPDAIDGDVILAAQAREVGGIVLTENRKHLERYVPVKTLAEVMQPIG